MQQTVLCPFGGTLAIHVGTAKLKSELEDRNSRFGERATHFE